MGGARKSKSGLRLDVDLDGRRPSNVDLGIFDLEHRIGRNWQ